MMTADRQGRLRVAVTGDEPVSATPVPVRKGGAGRG